MFFSGLGGKIFGLIFSIVLLIGGLSGKYVLKGTNSSTALVVAAVGFIIYDLYAIATHERASASQKKIGEKHLLKEMYDAIVNDPGPQLLSREWEIPVELEMTGSKQYHLVLNGQPAANISTENPKTTIKTNWVKNALRIEQKNEQVAIFLFEVLENIEPGSGLTIYTSEGVIYCRAPLNSAYRTIRP